MVRRGIAVLAVAALVCGCDQERVTPEEMLKQTREGFEYRPAMRYYEVDPVDCAQPYSPNVGVCNSRKPA